MSKYILLKINNTIDNPIIFNDPEKLKERASGNWRITLKTISQTKNVLLLYRGKVLAEYLLNDTFKMIRDNDSYRIKLGLDIVDNSNKVGKEMVTKTANPVSLMEEENMQWIN